MDCTIVTRSSSAHKHWKGCRRLTSQNWWVSFLTNRRPEFRNTLKLHTCSFRRSAAPSKTGDIPFLGSILHSTSRASVLSGLNLLALIHSKLSPSTCSQFPQPPRHELEVYDRVEWQAYVYCDLLVCNELLLIDVKAGYKFNQGSSTWCLPITVLFLESGWCHDSLFSSVSFPGASGRSSCHWLWWQFRSRWEIPQPIDWGNSPSTEGCQQMQTFPQVYKKSHQPLWGAPQFLQLEPLTGMTFPHEWLRRRNSLHGHC